MFYGGGGSACRHRVHDVGFSCTVERPSTSVATEGRAVLAPQHRPLLHGDNEAWNILALLGANNGLKSLFNPLLQAVDASLGVSGEERRACCSP